MASGLNPNIGLEELGVGSEPQAPVINSESTYTPYVPQGSGSNKTALGAGIDRSFAGLSEATRVYLDYSPVSTLMENLGLFDREEADNLLQQEAENAFNEFKKYTPDVASYKDIDSTGQLLDYIGENLAMGAPQIAALFLGPAGLASLGLEATGTTILEQEEGGLDKNVGRAILTGTVEAMLNLPVSKAAKNILDTVEKTNLDEFAKKSLAADLVKGIGTDIGTNGLQQIVRNYGVEGAFSLDQLDEAIVGGLIVASPIRAANAVVTKAAQNKITQEASDTAIKTGDIQKADGLVNKFINFTMGTALRPVRRIKQTESGNAIFNSIENMRHSRDLMTNDINVKVDGIFAGIKDTDSFISAYASGKRDTPKLQQLQTLMDDIHARANKEDGANLGVNYINNYLPTIIDPVLFNNDARTNLKLDYENWYNQNAKRLTEQAKLNGQEIKLVSPESAKRIIDDYDRFIRTDNTSTAKLPRVKELDDGTLVAPNPVEVKSPRKEGTLEKSRMLGFIPQHLLSEYSVKANMKEQLKQYGFSAAQRITYAENLGKNNEKLNVALTQTGAELKAKGRDYELTKDELNTVYDAMDAYQGTYNQFTNEAARKAMSVWRTLTNVTALPLTLLSSFTEPFNLAIKIGNVAAGKAFIKALGSMSQDLISTITHGLVPKSEINKQLLLTGRSFRDATTALHNRLSGDYGSRLNKSGASKVKSLTFWNNVFFHATGQTTMNYLVNSMAAHAASGQVKNDIMIVNGFKGSKLAQEAEARLNAVGIPASQFKLLHDNPSLMSTFMPSVVARFNKDVALNPEALDKPLWMSTGWGQLFGQLRGYPTMFSNTVLPKFIDMIDPRGKTKSEIAIQAAQFMSTFGSVLAIGFLQESLKNEARGGTATEEEIFAKAVRNTLMPIHVGYLMDIAAGESSRILTPAAASITDSALKKAVGEDVELSDLPIFSSFKGVL